MENITVTITDTELKALKSVAKDPIEWATNAVQHRSRSAINNICKDLLQHCNSEGIAMAVGQDAQVEQAYTLGLVKELAKVEESVPYKE